MRFRRKGARQADIFLKTGISSRRMATLGDEGTMGLFAVLAVPAIIMLSWSDQLLAMLLERKIRRDEDKPAKRRER
ncbi:hypothetical protein [Sphingomonas sp. Marseille-Q8236]